MLLFCNAVISSVFLFIFNKLDAIAPVFVLINPELSEMSDVLSPIFLS